MYKQYPLVSVVIPTYNRLEELERAVRSVLKQTFDNLEIIVVNDSKSEFAVKKLIYGFKDSRIKYFKNRRRKGGSGARNTGILNANGRYIALLDDDDEWMPKKLEKQIQKIEKLDSNWGGCYCGYKRIEGLEWKEYNCLKEGDIKKEYLLNKSPICGGSTLLFKKSVLNYIGLFDEELDRHQDTLFLVEFLRFFKIAYVNEVLVKINGHNFPSAKKIERAKFILIKKIRQDIFELTKRERKIFYAFQYIDLAIAFSFEGNIEKVIHYFLKSIYYHFSLSRQFLIRYCVLIMLFLNTITRKKFRKYLGLEKYKKIRAYPAKKG